MVKEEKGAVKAAPKDKIDIRFTKSPTGAPFYLAYNLGDVVSFEIKQAAELIDADLAEKA